MATYLNQTDLENAINVQTVLAIFDDAGTGTINQVALTDCLSRASAMVDSYLARVYRGPFPITQTPFPAMIKIAAIDFAVAYAFERHPEYVRSYGEEKRQERWARARDMMERICDGLQEMPDYTAQPKQANLGGIVYSAGPRTIIDNFDGTANGGDF